LKGLHTWGIVEGLSVIQQSENSVVVQPGAAIDSAGHEIRIDAAQTLSLGEGGPSRSVIIVLSYEEGFEEADRSVDDDKSYVRTSEYAVIGDRDVTSMPTTGLFIPLVRLAIDTDRRISDTDDSVRILAGARLAPGSVDGRVLAPDCVTPDKLHPRIRTGWVRMAFKPSPFDDPNFQGDFKIGVSVTRSEPGGAKGTQTIPVPPGATRLKAFRLCGERNDKGIAFELYRSGWDMTSGRHEKLNILQREIREPVFQQTYTVSQELDPENHTVTLFVWAKSESQFSLVAAEFELV
jgi:hypothetical protein